MTTYTEGIRGGDFLLSYVSPQANLFSCIVSTAAAGGNQSATQVIGLPVVVDFEAKTADLVAVASFGTANGFIVAGDTFDTTAQGTALPNAYTIVAKDGVAINEDALPATDAEGTAINAAAITSLEGAAGLAGFAFRNEPATKESQTS